MGERGVGRRLKVWCWSGRDAVSLADLEFMVAVASRKELHSARVRLRLPKPWFEPEAMRPADDGYELAVGNPGRVYWRDPGRHAQWLAEEALQEKRAGGGAYRIYQGRLSTPLHRPDPPGDRH